MRRGRFGGNAATLRSYLVVSSDGGEIDEAYPLAALAVPQSGSEPVFVATVLIRIAAGSEIVGPVLEILGIVLPPGKSSLESS